MAQQAKGGIRFLAVIALYQRSPQESASYQSLRASATRLHADEGSLRVLLYDNTPVARRVAVPPNVAYYTTGKNDGLADAFNFGLRMAEKEGRDWLITLDQDTALPPHFLTRVAQIARKIESDMAVAAIVPQITGSGRMLSPNWFWAGAIPRWFPAGFVGIPKTPTFAFNSASILRVSALREIGGYCRSFWLDNCDSALYAQLNRIGKKVFVAGDIQVEHDFSMLDKENKMTVTRYHNLLMSELAFWDLAMNGLARWERTARLAGRWWKHAVQGERPEFRKEALSALKRRLFYSRAHRLALWRQELEKLRPSLAGGESVEDLQQRLQSSGSRGTRVA